MTLHLLPAARRGVNRAIVPEASGSVNCQACPEKRGFINLLNENCRAQVLLKCVRNGKSAGKGETRGEGEKC